MGKFGGKFVFVPDSDGDSFCYEGGCEMASGYVKQREESGFGDDETFSLDYSLACFMLPRLRRFLEIVGGSPGCHTSSVETDYWHFALGEMVWFFEQYENDLIPDDGLSEEDRELYYQRLDAAQALFGKHIRDLWW